MTPHNLHLPDAEQIDAYIAGGLTSDERRAFEAHLTECPSCSAAVEMARQSDDAVRRLLAHANPPANFEDRLIQAVRRQPQLRLRISLPIRRAAIAAAAILAVSGAGYYGNIMLTGGSIVARNPVSSLRQLVQASALLDYPMSTEGRGLSVRGARKAVEEGFGGGVPARTDDFSTDRRDAVRTPLATGWEYKKSLSRYAVAADINTGPGTHDAPAQQLSDDAHRLRIENPETALDSFKPNDVHLLFDGKPPVPGLLADAQSRSDRGADQPQPKATSVVPASESPLPVDTRKVIRNGTMEFEVDSFDSSVAQITKIASESGGFVSTTTSEKLPNGKVKGAITLRVPPDRLDVLVLSLRTLGDLKSQQITAQDVSKQYSDLEGSLTAAKAMETRLLELIKSGNGQIKDLLAAEKELGVWREKIEKAEGEIRYYNNQIAMSTLSIVVYERDIKTPAAINETETADTGIEAEDVEKARNDAIKAIDDAQGRIVEAELKKFDAGQLAARIIADVPPEKTGGVIDRLKQLGRVARLEIHRQQTPTDGADPSIAAAPTRIERKPTRLVISLYNLANVAPRRTSNITLAAADVESVYAALLSQANAMGARVVTSNLNRADSNQATGSIAFEIVPAKLDPAQSAIAKQGEILKRSETENADTQNTTDSKHGFTLQLIPLSSVQPRETIQQTIATTDVASAYHALLDSANGVRAHIRIAQLNEQDRQNITAVLDFEVVRDQSATVDKSIATAGEIISRDVSRSSDVDNTVDTKVLMHLTMMQADRLPARETTTMTIQVTDTDKAANDAQAAAIAGGGKIVDSTINKDRTGHETAKVVLDVPLNKSGELLTQLKSAGIVQSMDSARDPKATTGPLAHAHIDLTFTTSDAIISSDTGLWATIRNGLSTSVAGLLWSVQLLVIGTCLIGPWVGIAWIIWRLWRRNKTKLASQ